LQRVTTLQTLLADRPAIHGEVGADLETFGLLEEGLQFLEQTVQPGWRTLETGSGYSTIVFAQRGAEHTCVVPNQPEVDRILAYCASRGIATDTLDFRVQPSERVLPTLDTGPLDLILIDGSHSFPQVFIDWFYTAQALKIGGRLMLDDVHVWTGRILRDFLAAEPAWRIDDELGGRTTLLTKVGEVDPDQLWVDQRYVFSKSHLGLPSMARMSWSMLRHGHTDKLAGHARIAVERRVSALRARRARRS
jgi:hypothetical protein